MSRWAQGVWPTKFCRNAAAVIAPPDRPPTFLMSAIGLSISRPYSFQSGSGQTRSPLLSPARRRAGHVLLHGAHVLGRLDRDPAAVESDALADHRQGLRPGPLGAVAQAHQAGRLCRAAVDRQQAAHTEPLEVLLPEHFVLETL